VPQALRATRAFATIAYIHLAWRRGIWLELHVHKPLYRFDLPAAGFDFDQSLREGRV